MKLLTFAALFFAAMPAAAQAPVTSTPTPGLIVALSVDQLSSDLFLAYRPHFTGGLKRLSDGIVFARGYQAHAATETCPGHATILTGAHPARSGVIANNWMDLSANRADKRIYCAEDERVPGSTSRAYTVSPYHLKVPALGDRMQVVDPEAQIVAIAGKDRSAVMMGGLGPDHRWWWSSNRFVTHNGTTIPDWAAQANREIARAIAAPRAAMPLSELCAARNKPVAIPGNRVLGTHRFGRPAGDALAFTNSPALDTATLTLASAAVRELGLGKDGATDLLAVGLAATDYVGHRYGNGGVEMCLQLESLDRALGRFFADLDRAGIDYAVVLTADHGGPDIVERSGPPAARVDPALKPAALNTAVAQKLGLQGTLIRGDSPAGDLYIDRSDPERHAAILREAEALLEAHPQVEAALTHAELQAVAHPAGSAVNWTPAQRARASFDAERSGDLVVLLKPGISPITELTGSATTHGSAWDYDRQVPIIFWWDGVPRAERAEPAQVVDIMPTLAALIGLAVPAEEIDGRCLALPGVACP